MLDKERPHKKGILANFAISLLLLLPSFLSAVAHSESDAESKDSKLVVIVTKEEDNSPLVGARVLITGPNGIEHSAKTDSNGEAIIRKLPRDELTLQVVATGLETAGKIVTLSIPVETITVNMKKSITLPDFPNDTQKSE